MSSVKSADVADELFEKACHAKYGPSRQLKKVFRFEILQHRGHHHATHDLLHATRPRFRSLRREHRRLRRNLMSKKKNATRLDGAALKPDDVRQEMVNEMNTDSDHLNLSQWAGSGSRRASASSVSSGGGRRVSHGKLVRPAPAALGVAKLKDHDGPDEPEIEKIYQKAITSFPDLNPAPLEKDKSVTAIDESSFKTIALTVTPRDIYYCSPRDVQLRQRLHRELVTWYFYNRSTSSALQGEERALAPGHPIKMCSTAAQVERMAPLVEEEGENEEGFDVFAGIGTKGFTFALSKVERRSLITGQSQGQSSPPIASSLAAETLRGAYKHRMRRVSLTTDLEIADSTGAGPVVANFGLVRSSAAPLMKRRDRSKRFIGPRKIGRSLGTALGPWVDHDPDLCDRHNHAGYLTAVAGSVDAYLEEQASGWISHSQLQLAWQDVAAAEGGPLENMNKPEAQDFKRLFDKLLDSGEVGVKTEEKQRGKNPPGEIMSTLAFSENVV